MGSSPDDTSGEGRADGNPGLSTWLDLASSQSTFTDKTFRNNFLPQCTSMVFRPSHFRRKNSNEVAPC